MHKSRPEERFIDSMKRLIWNGEVIPRNKGVTRMTTMEALTLLMLLATVVFGILNLKK